MSGELGDSGVVCVQTGVSHLHLHLVLCGHLCRQGNWHLHLVALRCEMGSRAHIGQALRALYTHKGRITCEGRVQSLPQFAHRVASLAEGLSRLGLQLGDRVVIASLNRFAFHFILSQLFPVNQ